MTSIPPKPSFSLVKSGEQRALHTRDLNDIKYMTLFNQVVKSCQSLETLQDVVDGHTEILQSLLKVLVKG